MSEPAEHDLAVTAAALTVTVDELRKVVLQVVNRLDKQVEDRLNEQDIRTKKQSLGLRVAFFGLAVDMVLSVVMLGLFIQNSETAAANTATSARLSALVNDGFCPQLAVFLGSYDPNSRPAGPGREAYEDAFSTFRKIWVDPLHCTAKIVPPRSDLGTPPPQPPPR